MIIIKLFEAIRKVCPVSEISRVNGEYLLTFPTEATDEQKTAAYEALRNYSYTQPQLGMLTLAYIQKLNAEYTGLNLNAADNIDTAKSKMVEAGVSFEQAGTLITFYDKGM